MTAPSEAEVRLLAEASRTAFGGTFDHEADARDILATGLHVVTDEQWAVIEAAKVWRRSWFNDGQVAMDEDWPLIDAIDAAMNNK
jgi:hypothetical protein